MQTIGPQAGSRIRSGKEGHGVAAQRQAAAHIAPNSAGADNQESQSLPSSQAIRFGQDFDWVFRGQTSVLGKPPAAGL